MMNLYKEHGVNPMGGCLPLLLQMPLLFGFYSALAYSIELRRAPWMLWVKDLSQPDYVFGTIPILESTPVWVAQGLLPGGVSTIEGQLRRYKEKIQDHRRTPSAGEVAGAPPATESGEQ